MDLYSKEEHGQIIWECSRSVLYVAISSLLYVLFCVAFLILLLEHPGILSCTISFVVVLLTIPIFYSEFNAAGLIKPLYMAFDYKEIMGVSDDWNYLFIGERTAGGIVEVPVQLRYITDADKIKLQEWVERKQRDI